MRLIKELPEIEAKIEAGDLNLSHVAQAQGVFRRLSQSKDLKSLNHQEKRVVLSDLEHKSVREGQKHLLKLFPEAATPKETEKMISANKTLIRLVLSEAMKNKLESVRALLGPKGVDLGYADLMEVMAELSITALKAKKFGKKRTASVKLAEKGPTNESIEITDTNTPSSDRRRTQQIKKPKNARYISQEIAHAVWVRDGGSNSGV